ncbi:beta-ketoacyl synthase N-terminal-like domain-containing protein, partial [Tahibacter sp.]|uniref:AprA-related methyltransferase n=1 Tax=Tahibacter sp. TaxID=2056211 RepID=UPI0028C3F725
MLELLNRYSHGLAVAPLVDALRRRGCLQAIADSIVVQPALLAEAFRINDGYLAVALRMFESLGWLNAIGDGSYEHTPAFRDVDIIPDDVMAMYGLPFEQYALADDPALLGPWLERSKRRWGSEHEYLADYLDGIFVIPLLLALRQNENVRVVDQDCEGRKVSVLHLLLGTRARAEIESLFCSRGWADLGKDGTLVLTSAGDYVWGRINITAAFASYRPMFLRVEELMFGDPKAVFAHGDDGHEQHLDRALNVLGSGFQHEKYFADLSALIVSVFDSTALAEQPKYIADTGCGDGSLLREIYETVKRKTLRGRFLDRYPLVLIGIDANTKALEATERTLQNYEHVTLTGDIGDPAGIVAALADAGIEIESTLHVRSFLDHDRTYRPPLDSDGVARWERIPVHGVHIDADGKLIPPAMVAQSTVEHLRRWSDAAGRHGLVMLEVHSLSAVTTARFLDEAENLHFDAYHSMSRQLLLDAKTFVMCAAQAGLFCETRTWRRYPKRLAFARIGLNLFKPRAFSLRRALAEDVSQIELLDHSWSAEAGLGGAVHGAAIGHAIDCFADGQFVVVADGQIVAAASCMRESGHRAPQKNESWSRSRAAAEDPVRLVAVSWAGSAGSDIVTVLVDFIEQYFAFDGCGIDKTAIDECKSIAVFGSSLNSENGRRVSRSVRRLKAVIGMAPGLDPSQAEAELAEFVLRGIVSALQRVGVFRSAGESYELERFRALVRLAPKYERYIDSLLNRLRVRGLVTIEEGRITPHSSIGEFALLDPESETLEFERAFPVRHPHFSQALKFVLPFLREYTRIISAEVDAAAVMFADGSIDRFGGIFQGEPASEYLNRLVVEAVASYVHEKLASADPSSPKQKIRILEVGTGSGATANALLRTLGQQPEHVDLCLSDISPAFLRYTQRRFSTAYPWVTYKVLDIGNDVVAQGMEAHSWDIIVAGNVLHDTRNIVFTLEQTRRLLKAGGLLVANEYTEVKEWHFAGGALLHGMWLFDDPEMRLDQFCLLGVAQWNRAMSRAGLVPLDALALPAQSIVGKCGQCVLLAEAPAHAAAELEQVGAPTPEVVPVPATLPVADDPAKPRSIDDLDHSAVELAVAVEDQVRSLLGAERSDCYSASRPLMEMGLDSVELVELKSLLGARFGIALPPAFLFECETTEKLISGLKARLRSVGNVSITENVSPQAFSDAHVVAERDAHVGAVTTSARPASVGFQPRSGRAVAVVGVSCRFPGGASSPAEYWSLLSSGREAVTAVNGRWQWPTLVDLQGKHCAIDQIGQLWCVDEFDAQFFHISPREAELMDPQHRLLLELSWEALEDAGYAPARLREESVGVFIGVCHDDYRDLLARLSTSVDAYVGSGSARAAMANRISHFYDISGPSLSIDTACSSSLVALHYAVESINSGECAQALVGSANLICSTTNSLAYHSAGMLSRSGVCSAFDASADGFVRGEGGAMLLLKPLEMAVEARDSIYGLVIGTAVGHGGQSASLTAPKPASQSAVIERAIRRAGIDACTVQYVEAHGTGTTLGDPIEIAGLVEAFSRLRAGQRADRDGFRCGIGTVKPSIGHLEAAAGFAGLIKVFLAMRNQLMPKTLRFNRLNPHIDLAGTPFHIVSDDEPWKCLLDDSGTPIPRRAGVSSFGSGGMNAHVVVEEYCVPLTQHLTTPTASLVVLSARTAESLDKQSRRLLAEIASRRFTDRQLPDLAYTLQVGREPMEHRLAFAASSIDEVIRKLTGFVECGTSSSARLGIHLGNVKESREIMAVLNEGSGLDIGISAAVATGKYTKLLELWVRGLSFDWEALYVGWAVRPRRMS